jgi:RNA polymerase sigma-70 factor, ECF subfamily
LSYYKASQLTEAIIFAPHYPGVYMENESVSIHLIDVDSEVVFERLFKTHFKGLHSYACTILRDEVVAEEMVQNVFFKLWEKRKQVKINESYNAYLYKSVYYECLNYMKHTKVRTTYQADAKYLGSEMENGGDRTSLKDLEAKLDVALKELPEQCRTIFQMSRFEELKYREIADRLGISVKTVENQMGKALKILRTKLVDFLPILVFVSLHPQIFIK